MFDLHDMLSGRRRGVVAFNMMPVRGPWGGSSAFVRQLQGYLRRVGFAVRFDLRGPVDVVMLVDPREAPNKPFGVEAIAAYKARNEGTRVIHRVNECDLRKGTAFMDRMLADANLAADHTVFISEWLRDHHAGKWFDRNKSHSVIYNGADDAVFYPAPGPGRAGGLLRVVTHHWSADERKGFDAYRELDRMIADGRLPGFEFRVIGRWPADIRWRSATTAPPASGRRLARMLRDAHVYLTASRWEPCGMHHVEGAQCGLPLVYHEDGGGIVEAGRKYGLPFRDDLRSALLEMRSRYDEYRARALARRPSGLAMCAAYVRRIEELMCGAVGTARRERNGTHA